MGMHCKMTLKMLPAIIPPRGFKDAKQFIKAMKELNNILLSHNIDDAVFRFRGSSTTGLSKNPNKPGKWFSSESDIDLSIQSKKLSDILYKAGKNPSNNIPGLFLPSKLEACMPELSAELADWNEKWQKEIDVKDIEPAVSDPDMVKHDITDIVYKE